MHTRTSLLVAGALLASYIQVVSPLAFDHNILRSRATINPATLNDSYDFVVIGGGLAGLVVAARLAENSTTTVLVIEAGGTGDDVADTINHPGNAYYAGLVGGTHDWQWTSVQQPSANNRVMKWPGGKLLGGSSAINGCYYVRPSSVEVDAWQSLISGMDGADNWTSDKFFEAMRKSETYTPPSDDIKNLAQVEYNLASHGTDGVLHTSYSGYMPAVEGQWESTLNNIGINTNPDPAGGDGSGAFITTSTINPGNWTRSYSKSAYIDPFYRPNLHVLTDNLVSHIVFSGTTATAVQYGDNKSVNVNKEVIVSGGPVQSPSILMRSGVGPQDVLDAAGVSTVLALPGVGQHLQDHLASQVVFSTNVETAGDVHANTTDPRATTDVFLSYVNSAVAYANTNDLVGDPNAYSADLMAQLDNATLTVPSTDPTVLAGYKAVYTVSAGKLTQSSSGQVELLLALNGVGTINIQAALQRPLSHGRLYINSSDPTVPPVIDPNYMVHPSDLTMLREGLKLARSIGMTEPLNASIIAEVTPGANITADADLDAWLLNDFHTEYHPSCSCSMLPLEQGGVVDAQLKVHGINNVRVVDSSVFPIEWASHMMAPTYGLAEKAAEIILAQYGSSSSSSTSSSNQPQQSSTHSGSIPQFSLHISSLLVALLAAAALL